MAQLQIEQIPMLSDNYVYLLHEPQAGMTARGRSGGRRAGARAAERAGLDDWTGSSRPIITPTTPAAISS